MDPRREAVRDKTLTEATELEKIDLLREKDHK